MKGSALISASWASLLRYHICQIYIVLVTHTVIYIASIAAVMCLILSILSHLVTLSSQLIQHKMRIDLLMSVEMAEGWMANWQRWIFYGCQASET